MIEQDKVTPEPDTSSSVLETNTYQQPTSNQYSILYNSEMDRYSDQASQFITTILIPSINKHKEVRYIQTFVDNFSIRIEEQSINKEVVVLCAEWGHFSIKIKIINIQGSNIKHGQMKEQGTYGNIYCGSFYNQQFVVKCLPIKLKESRMRSIKEWFLMKLCSTAQIGPKVQSYFGFDIIMFEDCIQFAMEQCQQISIHNTNPHQLFSNLAISHKLNIVHQDIKPQNIMFSPSFKTAVFIDFGLSKIISQEQGSKTFSNFVGCINYWGPEMSLCFAEKKARFIDLYYNDLHALQETIKCFKQQKISTCEYQQIYSGENSQFSYLYLILGKYYLFQSNYQFFWQLYKYGQAKHKMTNFINTFETQILTFLEQLIPNQNLLTFFNQFVTQKYKDTMIYSKLKMVFLISQKNCCWKEMFRNNEKHEYFQNRVRQMLEDYFIAQNNDKQKVGNLLKDIQLIEVLPFEIYLQKYLDFTSYMHNKYQIGAAERQIVVQIYQKNYQSQNASPTPTRRRSIEQTIIHALKWCLKYQPQQHQKNHFVMLFFRITDFLNILDIGTISQYKYWLEKIFNHKALNEIHKILFVLRVLQFINLGSLRIIPKRNTPRYQSSNLIRGWCLRKKTMLKKIQLELSDLDSLSPDFVKQYGLQITLFSKLKRQPKEEDYFDLYNQVMSRQSFKRILLIMPYIYGFGIRNRDNSFLCNQIYKIFREAMRDQQLQKEFIFQLITKISISNHTQVMNRQQTQNWFKQINFMMKRMKNEDIFAYQSILALLWNRAQQKQNYFNLKLAFLYQNDGILLRFVQGYKTAVIQKIQASYYPHICQNIFILFDLYCLAKKVSPQKQEQIGSMIRNIFIVDYECEKCRQARTVFRIVDKLQESIFRYHRANHQNNTEQVDNIVQQFIVLYQQLLKYVQATKKSQMKLLIKRGLSHSALFCLYSSQLQNKFMANINYYIFLSENQDIFEYFRFPELETNFRVILFLLKQRKPQLFVRFMFEIAEQMSNTLMLIKIYGMLQRNLGYVLKNCSFSQISPLLQEMLKSEENNRPSSAYISIVYSYLISFTTDPTLITRMLSAIRRKVNHIHFYFQREVAINIYGEYIMRNLNSKHRKVRVYNNRLVKLLMITNRTVDPLKKKQKGNIFMRTIDLKVAKYGEERKFQPPIQFKIK